MEKIRPQLNVFAEAMEMKLRKKDHRGRFLDAVNPDFALTRLWDEVRELDRAAFGRMTGMPADDLKPGEIEAIQDECVDLSNFASMIWWAMENLKGKRSKHVKLFSEMPEDDQ